MPVEADVIYRTKEQVVTALVQGLMARIPDAWVEEDGNLRIFFEVLSAEIEGVYLANQILRDNIWVQRANIPELRLHGEMYGLPIKQGLQATGLLKFTGSGGTFIPAGTEAAVDIGGDSLHYFTLADATIPSPGIPNAPGVADAATAGNVPAGTYTYAVSFTTQLGETILGTVSAPVTLSSTGRVNLTALSVGGPGTVSRKIYRSLSGGDYLLVAQINDNTTTTFQDNVAVATSLAPSSSTAEAVEIEAQAELEGVIYNVAVGTVNLMVTAPVGISSVINTTAFTGGTDEEDMETYRTRLLELIRAPHTGSVGDLAVWAEEVDGVESVTVFPNDNVGTPQFGHVTVRIVGPNGSIPPQSVLDAVQASLVEKDVANITIHTATFTPLPVNVTVAITPAAGFSFGTVQPSVVDAISKYIDSTPVGGTVYVAGIYDAVFGLAGVATLSVSAPSAPGVTATATQKPVVGTISVS